MAGGLAYLDNLLWAFVLIYSTVLVALLAAAWSRWCARHLRLFREIPEGGRVAGEQLVERFTLENRSGLPIRLVEVRDLSRLPGTGATRVLSLAPRQIVTWESTRRLNSRGRYELGPTEVRVADPFGLFPKRLTLAGTKTLVVYPSLVSVPCRSLPAAPASPAVGRPRGKAIAVPQRLRPVPRARTQPPPHGAAGPAASDLLLLLDLRHASHHRDGPEWSLDYAVTLAASVAHAAGSHGRAVALAASDGRLSRIPAGMGELQDRALLEYLATARCDGSIPFSELVGREMPGWRDRGGVVLITPDDGQEWVEVVATASAPGTRSLGIFIDPAGFMARPATKVRAQWRLVMDLWVVHRGDDLSRLEAIHGRAVV
ncbi:MAG: hypothetical protein WAO09_07060 [Candidatus Dormiibacterota bacterium]